MSGIIEIKTLDELEKIEQDWNRLLDEACDRYVFLLHEWVKTLSDQWMSSSMNIIILQKP